MSTGTDAAKRKQTASFFMEKTLGAGNGVTPQAEQAAHLELIVAGKVGEIM